MQGHIAPRGTDIEQSFLIVICFSPPYHVFISNQFFGNFVQCVLIMFTLLSQLFPDPGNFLSFLFSLFVKFIQSNLCCPYISECVACHLSGTLSQRRLSPLPQQLSIVTSSLARGDTYCPPSSPCWDLVCLCLPESCACCPVSLTFLTVSPHQKLV